MNLVTPKSLGSLSGSSRAAANEESTATLGRKSRKYSVELMRFEGPRPSRNETVGVSAKLTSLNGDFLLVTGQSDAIFAAGAVGYLSTHCGR